jgi:hypothetical protein
MLNSANTFCVLFFKGGASKKFNHHTSCIRHLPFVISSIDVNPSRTIAVPFFSDMAFTAIFRSPQTIGTPVRVISRDP